MALRKRRRKPLDRCASLSSPLEKHRGEHPSTPSSSQLVSSLSYSKTNPTPSREAALFLNGTSAWHGGREAGMGPKGFPRKCHWGRGPGSLPTHLHGGTGTGLDAAGAAVGRWPFASGRRVRATAQPLAVEQWDEEGNHHPAAGGSQWTAAGGITSELCLSTWPCCPRFNLMFYTSSLLGGRSPALSTSVWGY